MSQSIILNILLLFKNTYFCVLSLKKGVPDAISKSIRVRALLITLILQLFGLTIFAQLGQVVNDSYFPVKIKKKWGMINSKGEIAIQPQYDAIGSFKEYGYAVMQREGRIGLLSQRGKEVIPAKYDDIKILDSLLFAVLDASDWVVINIEGKVILKNGYEQVQIWKGEFIGFRKNKKWGLADVFGNILSAAKYDAIDLYEEDFFLTTSNEKLGLLSSNGKEILPNESEEIKVYNDNLFFFQKNKRWGAVNRQSQPLIRPSFQSFSTLSDNFIKLLSNHRVYLYSVSKEKMITKGNHDTYYNFYKKYVLAKKNKKLGLVNELGNEILDIKYDEVQFFDDNRFRVKKDGKWGVVGISDIKVVPIKYQYITPAKSNLCVVKENQKLGIANVNGLLQVDPKYDKIEISKDTIRFNEDIIINVTITNTGKRAGKEVVQLYVQDVVGSITRPVRELKGFQHVTFEPGETKEVSFTLSSNALEFTNHESVKAAEEGHFNVWIGPHSASGLKSTFYLKD